MSTLKALARKALPASSFGEPAQRKYPMPDKSHAANAKARASQQVKAGNLSSGAAAKIDRKANSILGKRSGSMSNSMDPNGPMLHPSDMPQARRRR